MQRLPRWTLAITAIAIFMVSLDNLVVSTALVSIREDLGASLEALEWTVNAYTLAFAVFLLTGAALGDRFGRRRMFIARPRHLHRGVRRGRARPEHRRADRRARRPGPRRRASSRRSASRSSRPRPRRRSAAPRSASGPASAASASRSARWSAAPSSRASRGTGSSGSTSRSGSSLAPLALRRLDETPRPGEPARPDRASRSARSACSASSSASCAATRPAGARSRWSSPIAAGASLLAAFIAWELRTPRADAADAVLPQARVLGHERRQLAMTFGMFGAIFLLAQFFQAVQGYSPLEAGLRTLPVDRHADARRADRGRAVRPARVAAADGGRACSCRRSRSAGSRS